MIDKLEPGCQDRAIGTVISQSVQVGYEIIPAEANQIACWGSKEKCMAQNGIWAPGHHGSLGILVGAKKAGLLCLPQELWPNPLDTTDTSQSTLESHTPLNVDHIGYPS